MKRFGFQVRSAPSRGCVVVLAASILLTLAGGLDAQTPVTAPFDPRLVPRGVLGGVPLSPADSAVQAIVGRLDFDSYKALIRGLTEFGDRQEGSGRDAQANDWIEAQLRSWGYETERLRYDYEGSSREQVYATKWGTGVPQEMYILGAHMDGLVGR